jgi:site-specific DNA recombinase
MAVRRLALRVASPTLDDPYTALYARVSTEDQADRNTIEGQKAFLVPYAAQKGWTVVDTYFDEGVRGGLPLAERPEGQRLLADAQAKRFARVLFYRVDRFGRNQADSLQAAQRLLKGGVQVVSATESFDIQTPFGYYMYGQLSGFAELQKSMIRENCSNGRRRLASEGRWLGGIVPYGFRVDGDRHLILSDHVLPEAGMMEWELVRDLIQRIAAGSTATAEAKRLNTLRVPVTTWTTRGKPSRQTSHRWHPSRIAAIVANPVYHGDGSLRSALGDIPRPVPAIVTQEEQARAQAQLRANRSFRAVEGNRGYLLRGRVFCGSCGHRLVGCGGNASGSRFYYRCPMANTPLVHPDEVRCLGRLVSAAWLEQTVWQHCTEVLAAPEPVLETLRQQLLAPLPATAQAEARIGRLRQQLEGQDAERARLLTLFRKDAITETELDAQYAAMTDERTVLARELAILTQDAQHTQAANDALTSTTALLATVQSRLAAAAEMAIEAKRQILADLRVCVTVTPPPLGTPPREGTSTVALTLMGLPTSCAVSDTLNRREHRATGEIQDGYTRSWVYAHVPVQPVAPFAVVSARVRAAQARARAAGMPLGRPRSWTQAQATDMLTAYEGGESRASLLARYGISRARLYHYLAVERARQTTAQLALFEEQPHAPDV